MARRMGAVIAFICLSPLVHGPHAAAAGDVPRLLPIDGASAAKAAVEAGIQIPARVLSVYDGDTVKVEAAMWPGLTWTGNVRVDGVDTPELRGKCASEKRRARAARDFVRKRLSIWVTLVNVRKGKYAGRVVARVRTADGSDLAELLIRAGHGRPYTGGRRRGWCGADGT